MRSCPTVSNPVMSSFKLKLKFNALPVLSDVVTICDNDVPCTS